MLEKYRDILTINEICEILNIGKNAVYRLLKEDTIRNIKIGRKYIVPKQNLIEYLSR